MILVSFHHKFNEKRANLDLSFQASNKTNWLDSGPVTVKLLQRGTWILTIQKQGLKEALELYSTKFNNLTTQSSGAKLVKVTLFA